MEKILYEATTILNHHFQTTPILYASYGLERVLGRSFHAHDIDLLIDRELLERPAELARVFESAGFLHLHDDPLTFRKSGIDVELADRERWVVSCGFSLEKLTLWEEFGCRFHLLAASDLLKLYQYLIQDPDRPEIKKRRDRHKILQLKKWIVASTEKPR